jgi:hypothetical protein
VEGDAVAVTRGEGRADLSFTAGPGIPRPLASDLAPERALATGVVEVLSGPRDLLGRFAHTFHLAA